MKFDDFQWQQPPCSDRFAPNPARTLARLTPHSSTHTLSFDWAYPVGLMGGCLRLFMPTSQSVSRRIGWLRYCLEYLIVVVAGSQAQNISFYDIDRSRCLYWQLNNGPTAINHGAGQVLVGSCCRACCLLPPQPCGNTYKGIASIPPVHPKVPEGRAHTDNHRLSN